LFPSVCLRARGCFPCLRRFCWSVLAGLGERAVVGDKLIELLADALGGPASPGFLAALVDKRDSMPLLLFGGERHMSCSISQRENMRRESKKTKASRESAHLEGGARQNNQSVNISAESLSVVDGDLVFSTNDVPVRVIAADTYTDVELIDPVDA
jgi:hypothetical protein